MAEGTSNSIVNLGEISKPADTLIKKVSKAIGGVFAPYQVTRMAKAEAEAAMIKAQNEIQITDLHRRAMHRFIEEEAQRQKNIEDITAKALPNLQETANADAVEDDWITNFFDKSRIVSNEDMQNLWAKVLAGEANSPGSFSKRTVNYLADLDKDDAELFMALCNFGCYMGRFTPLIFDHQNDLYKLRNLNFGTLTHLDSIGLIQFNPIGGFTRTNLLEFSPIFYCGKHLLLRLPNGPATKLRIGQVLLTKAGEELATICKTSEIEGFFDLIKQQWKSYVFADEKSINQSKP